MQPNSTNTTVDQNAPDTPLSQEGTSVGTSKASSTFAPPWIILMATATAILFLAAGGYASGLPKEQYARALWVQHTREVMEQLARLALHVTEAETSQRGYLLTGDMDSLAPYDAAVRRISINLDKLHKLVADYDLQTDRLTSLHNTIRSQLARLNESIAFRKDHKPAAALSGVPLPESDHGMQAIRAKIDTMWKEENTLLQSRMKVWQNTASRTQFAVIGCGLIISVLIGVTGLSMLRLERQQRKLTEAEREVGNVQRAKAEKLMEIVMVQREMAGHALDLDLAMQKMTEHTGRLTRAEGSIVEILEGTEMVYRAASGLAAPHIGLRLKAAGSLSGLCVKEGAVLKCDDSETDQRVDRAACRNVGLRSMVVVPLRHQEQRLGVLKVLSSNVSAFNDDDIATLELLAGVLSGALSDAGVAETLRNLNEELVDANTNLEKLATTDGMTGLKNHRTFQQTLAHEFQRACRYEKPLSLLLLDVDHFKKFNDSFGHPAGDTVLKQVAKMLQENTRETDHAARYGGEEFAVLLPETDAQGAMVIAERIREAIASNEWQFRAVTVSVGVSTVDQECLSEARMIAAADQALYQSKHDGRNRVTHYAAMQLVTSDSE